MAVSDATRKKVTELLEALEHRPSGQDATEFWEAQCPDSAEEQSELAEAFDRHGVDLFNQGEVQAALHAFWPVFLLRLELVKQHPTDRGAIRDFASAEYLIGRACIRLQKLDVAEQMLSESLHYRRSLFEDEPSDAHAALLYGVALNQSGQLERAKGDDAAAKAYLQQACDHLAEVNRNWPNVSFIETELTDALGHLRACG